MIEGKKKRALGTGACIVIIFLLSMCWHGEMNSDIFFMYKHGADLLAGNWDRSYDFVSAVEGLPFMHQKWAMCILVNRVIDWFGLMGINVGGTVFFFVTGLLGFFIAEDLWPGKRHKKLLAAAALMCVLCSPSMFSFRPHVVAGWCLMVELWALEKYASGRLVTWRLCLAMAGCSFVTMWFHSTMWTFCFVPLLPYLCESRFLSKVPGIDPACGRFRKAPLLASAAMMVLAGCLNPAGPGQLSYLALTATAMDPDTYWFVYELQPVWYASQFESSAVLAVWIAWTLAALALAVRGRRPRDLYLWAGSVLIMCMAMRMVFQAMLFMWFASARFLELHDVDPDDASGLGLKSWLALGAAVTMLLLQFWAMQLRTGPDGDRIIGAWKADGAYRAEFEDLYDFMAEDGGPEPTVFLLEADVGSYLNYLGARCLMDTRCELYSQTDATGRSVVGSIRELALEGAWDGRPVDADCVREFLGCYGIRYVLLRPDDRGMDHVFVRAVQDACEVVRSDGVFDIYRVP